MIGRRLIGALSHATARNRVLIAANALRVGSHLARYSGRGRASARVRVLCASDQESLLASFSPRRAALGADYAGYPIRLESFGTSNKQGKRAIIVSASMAASHVANVRPPSSIRALPRVLLAEDERLKADVFEDWNRSLTLNPSD